MLSGKLAGRPSVDEKSFGAIRPGRRVRGHRSDDFRAIPSPQAGGDGRSDGGMPRQLHPQFVAQSRLLLRQKQQAPPNPPLGLASGDLGDGIGDRAHSGRRQDVAHIDAQAVPQGLGFEKGAVAVEGGCGIGIGRQSRPARIGDPAEVDGAGVGQTRVRPQRGRAADVLIRGATGRRGEPPGEGAQPRTQGAEGRRIEGCQRRGRAGPPARSLVRGADTCPRADPAGQAAAT